MRTTAFVRRTRQGRALNRQIVKSGGPQPTPRQLKTVERKYFALMDDQDWLREVRNFASEELAAIIGRLSNLKHVAISNSHDMTREGRDLHSIYASDNPYQKIAPDLNGAEGLRAAGHLNALLHSFDRAGTKLESFSFGFIDWRIFEDPNMEDWEVALRVIQTLKCIKIRLFLHCQGFIEFATAISCRELFRQGRPLTLLRSMPFLANLETDLLGFFDRHSHSLRVVELTCGVIRQGSWASVFRTMRRSLRLDDCKLSRLWNSSVEEDQWDVDTEEILPARHCVKTLYYNVGELQERDFVWDSAHIVGDAESSSDDDDIPHGFASERGRPDSQAGKDWAEYQALFLDQQTLRDKDHGEAWITAILGRLTNLKHLYLNNWDSKTPREPDSPYGLPQTHSVLRAIDTVGTKLESLQFWCVNWRLFETQEELHEMMKTAVSTLQEFTLNVRTNEDNDLNHQASAKACAELFRQSRPLDFFQSMPCLQVLGISFEVWDDQAERVDLKYVVGQFCWPGLRKVSFNGPETTSEELLQFFQRHAETLRNVTLDNINLVQGSWPDVFRYMRTSLNLEEAGFSYDFVDYWDVWYSKDMRKYVLGKIDMSFEDIVDACQSLMEE
ncbi:MAG: hypothetical protein L6R42_008298 [Xanthoria sp. 1 TBL-2021]|nr:MAG: hypothetical protein L6R42_008298 [Xanthoria sp. 1 TBL-2021]